MLPSRNGVTSVGMQDGQRRVLVVAFAPVLSVAAVAAGFHESPNLVQFIATVGVFLAAPVSAWLSLGDFKRTTPCSIACRLSISEAQLGPPAWSTVHPVS